MTFTIHFNHRLSYRPLPPLYSEEYPALPVRVKGPSGADDILLIVDSGATYTLLNGERAGALGLDLTKGEPKRLSGMAGSLPAYLHEVTLEIEQISIQAIVAFSESPIERELLGRTSVFARLQLAFRERLSYLYLAAE